MINIVGGTASGYDLPTAYSPRLTLVSRVIQALWETSSSCEDINSSIRKLYGDQFKDKRKWVNKRARKSIYMCRMGEEEVYSCIV